MEGGLGAIWLELPRIDCVGRHDDFFSLGCHSLLALRLLSGMEKAFGISLPVGAVFLRPTLAGLAEALGDSQLAEEAAPWFPSSRRARLNLYSYCPAPSAQCGISSRWL